MNSVLQQTENRRKERRLPVSLPVKMPDAEGRMWSLRTEDLSAEGVRIRSDRENIAELAAHREEVPIEIQLQDDATPTSVWAELRWTYPIWAGGTMSGWRFTRYGGDARERIRRCIAGHGKATMPGS